MAHSIELLPDAAGDALIRARWEVLLQAGLPSRGSIEADTNRPHCSLLAAPHIARRADAAMAPLVARLPVEAILGPPAVFPMDGGFTLAAGVVPNVGLLSLQTTAVRFAGGCVDHLLPHCDPGQWTPHITLAHRLSGEQLATALELIDWTPVTIRFTAIRRWDGDARTEHVAAGITW